MRGFEDLVSSAGLLNPSVLDTPSLLERAFSVPGGLAKLPEPRIALAGLIADLDEFSILAVIGEMDRHAQRQLCALPVQVVDAFSQREGV